VIEDWALPAFCFDLGPGTATCFGSMLIGAKRADTEDR
jgi:hypothetical protein